MSNILEELEKFDKDWSEAKTTKQSTTKYQDLPDGKYKVKIKTCLWKKARTGRLGLSMQLQVLEGEFKNRVEFKNNWIGKGPSIQILKKELAKLGEAPAKLSELDCSNLIGKNVFVQIITKGEYRNVNIIGQVGNETAGDSLADLIEKESPF